MKTVYVQARKTAYITIGNSDNKLTQQEWSAFTTELISFVRNAAHQIHFTGYSLPDAPWQNMCVSFSIIPGKDGSMIAWLKSKLRQLATGYRQDSIALLLVDGDAVEMVKPYESRLMCKCMNLDRACPNEHYAD